MSLVVQGKLKQYGYCKTSLYITRAVLESALSTCKKQINESSGFQSIVTSDGIQKFKLNGNDPCGDLVVQFMKEALDIECEYHQHEVQIRYMNSIGNWRNKQIWQTEKNGPLEECENLVILHVPLEEYYDINVIPTTESSNLQVLLSKQRKIRLKLGEGLIMRGHLPYREIFKSGSHCLVYYFGNVRGLGVYTVTFKTWTCELCSKEFRIEAQKEKHLAEGRCIPKNEHSEYQLSNRKKIKRRGYLPYEKYCPCGAIVRTKTGFIMHKKRCGLGV